MYSYVNNQVCIGAKFFIEQFGINAYRNALRRRHLERANRGCNSREAYIIVDSLRDDYKARVVELLGDYRNKPATGLIDKYTIDQYAQDFYESFLTMDSIHLPPDRIKEYTANASMLATLKTVYNDALSMRMRTKGPRLTLSGFFGEYALEVESIQSAIGHSLPSHPRRLQKVFERFSKEGYIGLIHKGYGNNNSAKIKDIKQESFLVELLADPRNFDNVQVSRFYNMIATNSGWDEISPAAVAVWRDKLDLVTYAGRRGGENFRNNKSMTVKRSRPTQPLLMCTVDGWVAELLYQESVENKKGHNVTTFHNRATIVIVLDPCLNYPLGYAIGTHECPSLINAALRNAINHTTTLFGRRYGLHQIQTDNYGKGVMDAAYQAVADKYTPARSHNAKAKVIEPWFKYFNKTYCQIMPNWSGVGVTSQKRSQPNSESLNKYKHNFPDFDGVCSQLDHFITMERERLHERYMELWTTVPEDKRLPMSDERYLYHFGAETGHLNAIEASGLRPTIEGIKREYDCFDINFRKYTHLKWRVLYDPNDLSKVLAVSEDGRLRFMLEAKHVQPMALAERKDDDTLALARVNHFTKAIEAHITERRAIAGEIVRDTISNNPALEDTLTKHLLTDSFGQHKDQKSRARRLAAKDINIDNLEYAIVAPKTQKQPQIKEKSIYELM